MVKKLLVSVITLFFMCFFSAPAYSADVTLKWNSVAEADGYKVYYGTVSEVYNIHEDAGNQTSYTITLDPGTYYFALTAYNVYGESGYSEEVGPIIIEPIDPEEVPPAPEDPQFVGVGTAIIVDTDILPDGRNVTRTEIYNGGNLISTTYIVN